MKKLMRREEKKISRKDVRVDGEQEEYLKALGFNPTELRMKRSVFWSFFIKYFDNHQL